MIVDKGQSLNQVFRSTGMERHRQYSKKGRVLIVEDNADSVRLYSHFFDKVISIRFDIAQSGSEAITLFRENEYTHLLTDLGLPDYDGIQLKKDLDCIKPPLNYQSVAMTGYGGEELKSSLKAAGFDRYLTKPVPIKEIKAIFT